MADGIPLNTSYLTKNSLSPTVLMAPYGEARTTPMSVLWSIRTLTNHLKICLTGQRFPVCRGMSDPRSRKACCHFLIICRHDVGLQIVGQPSRDLCRHFVQRWNLLIRTKNHKRRMPFLLPAAEFTERELQDLKLQGTCEVQICRSVGPWSMGTSTKIEHSIQNAYCKCECALWR